MTKENWNFIVDTARQMGASDHDIAKFSQRHVPHKYRLPIYIRAQKEGVDISEADFVPERVKAAREVC